MKTVMNFEQPQFDAPPPEKKKSTLKQKLQKAVALGAVAAAAIGGEACAPKEGEAGSVSVGAHPESSAHAVSSEKFTGYGVSTETKGGKIVKTQFGEEKDGKKTFSGYGIETESGDDEIKKSPYGESSGSGKKKFKGYGIER